VEAGAKHPRTDRLTFASTTRRLVGVDLGTTNSAVVWVDATQPPRGAVPQLFAVPQLVAAREVGTRPALPSFVYLPTPQEQADGMVALPWAGAPEFVVGVFARDHGALVPTRLVSSAKSWLSNPSVDRRAALLPWTSEALRISPVDAAARVLMHLRDAWNHVEAAGDPGLRLEEQSIILTVPASFDEEARELTVDAARAVGLTHLTLLEEPIAAVYAWMSAHPRELPHALGDGQVLLVCDVGGGTTDFSLIRANEDAGGVHFERVAIGEHLLLGGDNVDVALAGLVERKIMDRGERLHLTQRQILRRQCSAAKEQVLGPAAPQRVAITILGAGRGVVAGAMTTELTREEVTSTLDTFLPPVGREQRLQRHVRPALRELGLPYESDPAITRHLAAFLARSAHTISGSAHVEPGDMARPDAILFNGGFFTPMIARERILEACASWFGTRPAVLANEAPQAAVAIGAAFYGIVRCGAADVSNLLIRAGSPRSYYIAIEGDAERNAITAVCVLPRSTPEGTHLVLDREFTVIANQPVAFTLLSSRERTEAANSIVTFTPEEEVHRHAPLVTSLRYGQRSRRVPLKVRLSLLFTEIGTIELWCESVTTEHRWRLQFNLRAHDTPADASSPPRTGASFEGETTHTAAVTEVIIPDDALARTETRLRDAFTGGAARSVDLLIGEIENALGHGKHAWPLLVLRRLADVLLEIADSRRFSARHETRWLNLVGFCMRPGFGTSLDPWRISEIRKVYAAGLVYSKDVQCQVEWLILWQRVSAGFTMTQQKELAARMIGLLGMGARKAPHLNSQMVREAWRLLAGLERLDRQQRRRLGDELIPRVRRESQNASFLWAMGRFGARVPAYGPLNAIVPPAFAESWLEALRATKSHGNDTYAAVAEMAARTDDPARDVSDQAREATLTWLEESGAPSDIIRMVRQPIATHRSAPASLYGEPLPLGLRLDEQ
jgi:molecular chaperone DnaK (HSP70)